MLILLTTLFSCISCETKPQPVQFLVLGTEQALFAKGRTAVEGKFNLSDKKKIEYRFASSVSAPPATSFEIKYSLTGDARPVLEVSGRSWMLPVDTDFGEMRGDFIYHYAIPVEGSLAGFTITSSDNISGSIQIHSVSFTERWYGFFTVGDNEAVHRCATPFVSQRDSSWVIEPLAGVPTDYLPVLSVMPRPWKNWKNAEPVVIEAGKTRVEVLPYLYHEWTAIPAGLIALDDVVVIPGNDQVESFRLMYEPVPSFPEPIVADPGLVITWPQKQWRDKRYEVFKWDRFPSLLIFDFIDYDMQDRMLKRLAFFVEKTGFRGRLAPDAEIEELHAWNAHDYRAEDLARFFQLAREKNFPLLPEERELQQILLNSDVIIESGGSLQAGEGGMISISRESAEYLRYRFMAHEGFHGLFFIDEDFRNFSRQRWQQFPADAKRFLVSFFGFQQYDTADEYLLINEFMGHILQQPVTQANYYFGQNLPSRLVDSWRNVHLPEKDEDSDSWPTLASAFTREAEEFSKYVGRWGLAAGRVHLVTIRQD